ncbi:helix-turn-helix domain-containing protein [Sporomusa sphaeroides DSM 2875]|uniref:helix-turn-helix domain-containing protein n=1 Tax=Sporomusa sphaeroides TaxID=47679 RepID=UPI00202F51B9|nr:helix-turn-helix domain-containing protein [Sporomusa sphaeroides DSM 2875]
MTNIGERIRELRKQKNLTSEALGEAIGVSQSFISGIENGSKKCSLETLGNICDVLGITLSDFFKTEDLAKRALRLSENMNLSDERKTALDNFKGMSLEEQTKRLLAMYEKLKGLPPEQQEALEVLINHLSVRQ